MIKALIFDIDGVLTSTKKLHENAFIRAVNEFGFDVTKQTHKELLDGLPTRVKLDKLAVPENVRNEVFNLKQKYTFEEVKNHNLFSQSVYDIFQHFKCLKLGICSNAIRPFCNLIMEKLKVKVECISNDDAKPKPDPDMYIKMMEILDVLPNETLIFEDSVFGLESGYRSGGNVVVIENPRHLTINKIEQYIGVYK